MVTYAGEEMGLGKTVEIAALVLSCPAPPLQAKHELTADGLLISRYALCQYDLKLLAVIESECW